MKYKILGIVLCIAVVLSSVVLQEIPNKKAHRYHQHTEALEYKECAQHSPQEAELCTHLPIVEIDTGGEAIPGKAILNAEGRLLDYTTTAEGLDEILAHISIKDNEDKNNHLTDESALESTVKIHIRGNSSRTYDKSGYDIRLVNFDGTDNPQNMMGMDAHHEWILHGPFLDRTLIKNYMWYNISGEIMDYAPNVRFCEVVINGEYQGLYVMTEPITAGKDNSRLSLQVSKKNSSFNGYVLRLDRGSNTEAKNIDTFSKYSYRTVQQMNIVYPGNANLNDNLKEKILQDFSDFEKTLYSYDYDNNKYGYKNMIDVDSFVNYFIINEFTCNYDAGWLSTYVYKDVDKKFKLCVWDMNSACDGYSNPIAQPFHFGMQNALWYVMLCKDEDFVDKIISNYESLRKTYLNDDYLISYIDSVIEYLGPAISRNYEKWGDIFDEEYLAANNPVALTPAERNPKSYEEAIADIKEFIVTRGNWLDDNIEILKQYSAESKVKKFNEVAN